MDRRSFLRATLVAGGGLCLGFHLPGCGGRQKQMRDLAKQTGDLRPNMYITVKPNGRIELACNKAEMGQGTTTGYCMLVAEELEVPLDQVDCRFADSQPEYRTSFGMHQTGGSTSILEAYIPLRVAAASAREMLVAAAATTWSVPRAQCTAEAGQVKHAASGRALPYGQLTVDAAQQDIPDEPALKEPGQFKLVGKSSRRVDSRAKVDGTAPFGMDVSVPGMVRAYVIHGPVYGARPTSINADRAKAMPGIIDIFAFEWGVAVVADKYWQAKRAAGAVEVEWGKGHVEGLDSDAMKRQVRAWTIPGRSVRNDGDAEDVLKKTGMKVVEAAYEAPYLAHAPMEPMNCTVAVNGDTAEVWVPAQSPSVIQAFVGDVLGIPHEDVLVHITYMGGGFGRRGSGDYAAQAALIAKRVGRPVQMIWSRESDMTQAFYRPLSTIFMRGAVDDNGGVAAMRYHSLSQPISMHLFEFLGATTPRWMPGAWKRSLIRSAMGMFGSNSVPDLFAAEGAQDTPYRIKNVRVEYTPINSELPMCFWRSVGHSYNAFAIESFVDEMAHAAGQDPYRFRRQMLEPDSREMRVLDAVAKLSSWGQAAPDGYARGIARHTSFFSEAAQVIEAKVVDGRIDIRRVYCVIDCGVAVNPDLVAAQMESSIVYGLSAALRQEITIENGVVQQDNFDSFPALRMHDSPEIIVEVLPSDNKPTGAGEPGLPPAAPALANAIFAATGVRLRAMPLEKAWAAHQASKGGAS